MIQMLYEGLYDQTVRLANFSLAGVSAKLEPTRNSVRILGGSIVVGGLLASVREGRVTPVKALVVVTGLVLALIVPQSLRATESTSIHSPALFNENFQPNRKVVDLLKVLGMEASDQSEYSSITRINEWAQKNLLRRGERWESQTESFNSLAHKITPLLSQLGFVQERTPGAQEYTAVLVHGAILQSVRVRVSKLIELWKEGIRFDRIYFLSGERPLVEEKENVETLASSDPLSKFQIRDSWNRPNYLPKTECEMIRWVWEQALAPVEMRDSVKVSYINAPMKVSSTGEQQRPSTDDTVLKWLEERPAPGRYLAISNQPYITRQDLVLKSYVNGQLKVETVGDGVSGEPNVVTILDEFARTIYQIQQVYNKSLLKKE